MDKMRSELVRDFVNGEIRPNRVLFLVQLVL